MTENLRTNSHESKKQDNTIYLNLIVMKVLGKLCNFEKLWKFPLMEFI